MTWWLTVFFFINGTWVPGADIDGWAPRAYASEASCHSHKAFAERQMLYYPLEFEAYWMCSPGAPAAHPPASVPQLNAEAGRPSGLAAWR